MCDPIDGTTNFAHGLPVFCSSIALEVDGELEVGAVYDPMRDELFTASRGGGAFLNGARLTVSRAATLIDALLVTGFPYSMQQKLEDMVALFARFLSESRAVRRLGSAALDLCYVAAGRFDGFWEEGLNAWDIAAGVLLVAGGRRAGDGSVRQSPGRSPWTHPGDQRAAARRDGAAHRRAPHVVVLPCSRARPNSLEDGSTGRARAASAESCEIL